MAKTNYQSIDEYHDQFSEELRHRMSSIRECIHSLDGNIEELISYQIPCFKYNGYLIYYSAYNHHITLSYPYSEAFLSHFKEDLKTLKVSKSAIQFPHAKPLPLELIKKMVAFRLEENRLKKK